MPTWAFSGTLLPTGEDGEIEVGNGPLETLPGHYALPGLVDAHCHLTVDVDDLGPFLGDEALAHGRLRDSARAGVTIVRDVGGRHDVTLPLGRQLTAGWPRVFAAGRFFAPAGRYFPRMFQPVQPEQLVQAVNAQLDAGASWIKLIGDFRTMDAEGTVSGEAETTYPAEIVKDVVDAAHARSARVAVHTNTSAVGWMVRAGVDSVEHGLWLSTEDLAELGRRGGAWTPTLCAVLGVGPPEARDDAAQDRSRLMAELVSVAKAAGVQILAGTDVVGSIDREIALLVEHGLPVAEALRAASVDATSYLGAPSDSGDLVTYERDPREQPEVLAMPAAVVVRGVRVR